MVFKVTEFLQYSPSFFNGMHYRNFSNNKSIISAF